MSEEIAKIPALSETPQVFSMFANTESFEHVQRIAAMFSKSELIPKRYQGNIQNCIIALEMAARMGASPIMVMQNLDVILGKPAWSSKFLIATLNASGRFSTIRYEEDDKDGGRTRAWVIDKSDGERLDGEWVSMKMAKEEGWIDKAGSKWKTMPGHMRRYRAASFFINEYAPEISMGLQTVEEVVDVGHVDLSKEEKADKQSDKIKALAEKQRLDAASGEPLVNGEPEKETNKQGELPLQ